MCSQPTKTTTTLTGASLMEKLKIISAFKHLLRSTFVKDAFNSILFFSLLFFIWTVSYLLFHLCISYFLFQHDKRDSCTKEPGFSCLPLQSFVVIVEGLQGELFPRRSGGLGISCFGLLRHSPTKIYRLPNVITSIKKSNFFFQEMSQENQQ